MIGGLGPDEPEESGRREGDTEPIPRTPDDSVPSEGEEPHFVGQATVGATAAPRHIIAAESVDDLYSNDKLPEFTAEELAGLRFDASGVPLAPRRVLPLEDEPSSLVARYLFPTERYRGEWRRHWIHLSKPIAIGVIATFALGYLSGFLAQQDVPGLWVAAVAVWTGVMGWIAWVVADWYFDRFILTNKRLMLVSGIITRKVAMMPLTKVTDMKYQQTPAGRMLSYGTFVLESAGQDQALSKIEHMPNPNELYLRIVEEMYEPAAVEARLGRDPDEED